MCCFTEAKGLSFQLTVVKRIGRNNCFCSLSPFNKNIETLRSVIIGMPFHYNEKDMEKQEQEKGSGDTNNVLLGSISHQNSRIYTPNCWLVVHQLQLASLRQTRQWDTERYAHPLYVKQLLRGSMFQDLPCNQVRTLCSICYIICARTVVQDLNIEDILSASSVWTYKYTTHRHNPNKRSTLCTRKNFWLLGHSLYHG